MKKEFTMESNNDFYCYIKSNLPKGFKIKTEPSKSYYSQWKFRYILFKENEKIKEIKGDYRKIKNDELKKTASEIINLIEVK